MSPLILRLGDGGFAALFPYGTVVLIGVSQAEEAAFLQKLGDRIERARHRCIGDRDRNGREDFGRFRQGQGSVAAVPRCRCRRACQECRARL